MRSLRAICGCLAAIVLTTSNCTRQSVQEVELSHRQKYVTRKSLEPDKLASIWLIKKYLDREATFVFVEDDVPLTNGIPFDTPEAEFRRYANLSCFESILKKHPITDPAVQHLGELIHDIEVNFWGEKRFAESDLMNREIREIIRAHVTNRQSILEKSFAVFDRWARMAQTNSHPASLNDNRSRPNQ